MDSTIDWINHHPLDNSISFVSNYPLDSVIHPLNNWSQKFSCLGKVLSLKTSILSLNLVDSATRSSRGKAVGPFEMLKIFNKGTCLEEIEGSND